MEFPDGGVTELSTWLLHLPLTHVFETHLPLLHEREEKDWEGLGTGFRAGNCFGSCSLVMIDGDSAFVGFVTVFEVILRGSTFDDTCPSNKLFLEGDLCPS